MQTTVLSSQKTGLCAYALATADGMNNFQTVAVSEYPPGVIATGQNFAINLYRQTLAGDALFLQVVGDTAGTIKRDGLLINGDGDQCR